VRASARAQRATALPLLICCVAAQHRVEGKPSAGRKPACARSDGAIGNRARAPAARHAAGDHQSELSRSRSMKIGALSAGEVEDGEAGGGRAGRRMLRRRGGDAAATGDKGDRRAQGHPSMRRRDRVAAGALAAACWQRTKGFDGWGHGYPGWVRGDGVERRHFRLSRLPVPQRIAPRTRFCETRRVHAECDVRHRLRRRGARSRAARFGREVVCRASARRRCSSGTTVSVPRAACGRRAGGPRVRP
jgi:hypothetical protein